MRSWAKTFCKACSFKLGKTFDKHLRQLLVSCYAPCFAGCVCLAICTASVQRPDTPASFVPSHPPNDRLRPSFHSNMPMSPAQLFALPHPPHPIATPPDLLAPPFLHTLSPCPAQLDALSLPPHIPGDHPFLPLHLQTPTPPRYPTPPNSCGPGPGPATAPSPFSCTCLWPLPHPACPCPSPHLSGNPSASLAAAAWRSGYAFPPPICGLVTKPCPQKWPSCSCCWELCMCTTYPACWPSLAWGQGCWRAPTCM